MAISTNPKPTIYRSLLALREHGPWCVTLISREIVLTVVMWPSKVLYQFFFLVGWRMLMRATAGLNTVNLYEAWRSIDQPINDDNCSLASFQNQPRGTYRSRWIDDWHLVSKVTYQIAVFPHFQPLCLFKFHSVKSIFVHPSPSVPFVIFFVISWSNWRLHSVRSRCVIPYSDDHLFYIIKYLFNLRLKNNKSWYLNSYFIPTNSGLIGW